MLVLMTALPVAPGAGGSATGTLTPSCPGRVYHGEAVALKEDVRPFKVELSPWDGLVYNPGKENQGYFDFLNRRPNPDYPNVRSKDLWVYAVVGQARGCYIQTENGELTPVV